MNQSIITTLVYETKVSIGSYFHLVTDWFASDQEIKTVIIDQDHVYSKILSLYPNGLLCTWSKTKMALFTEPIFL